VHLWLIVHGKTICRLIACRGPIAIHADCMQWTQKEPHQTIISKDLRSGHLNLNLSLNKLNMAHFMKDGRTIYLCLPNTWLRWCHGFCSIQSLHFVQSIWNNRRQPQWCLELLTLQTAFQVVSHRQLYHSQYESYCTQLSLNSTFSKGMGSRLGNGISPCYFAFREVEYDRPSFIFFVEIFCFWLRLMKLACQM